jgi:hypothetical protein
MGCLVRLIPVTNETQPAKLWLLLGQSIIFWEGLLAFSQ